MRSYGQTFASFRSSVISPAVPSIKGVDLYAGILLKGEVAADFFEAVPMNDRLILAIGYKLVSGPGGPPLNQTLGEVNLMISVCSRTQLLQ